MALWENVIGYGTHADRPAAGAPGALYCESDTGLVVRDNGTSWDIIAGQSGLAFLSVAADQTLLKGNVNVLVTAAGVTLTLPPVSASAGQVVNVTTYSGAVTCTVQPAGSDTFNTGGPTDTTAGTAYVCDGANWFRGNW